MAIEIERTFEVEQPIEEVWAFLITPERVVECLPGAELEEAIDERTYRGRMGVNLGPIGVTFEGQIHFDELDETNHEVEMSGQAEDAKGTGNVKMRMRSRLHSLEGGGTRIEVSQTVHLAGKLASFGRGGIIQNVADFMFGRFTDCVTERLAEG